MLLCSQPPGLLLQPEQLPTPQPSLENSVSLWSLAWSHHPNPWSSLFQSGWNSLLDHKVPQGHDSSHPAPQSEWSACCFLLPLIPVCFILHYIIVSSDTILKSKPTVYVSWTNFRKYRKIRKGSLLVFASQVFFLWTYSRHSNIQKRCMINTDF